MSIGRALVLNTLWYGAVTAVGMVSGLVMSIILARGLGPELMGEYSYVTWATRMMEVLTILGFSSAAARYTAQAVGRGEPALGRAWIDFLMRRQVVATIVFVIAVIPVVLLLAPAQRRLLLVVAALSLVPRTVEGVYTNALYGAQRYDLTARASTVKMALQIAATVAALALTGDVAGVVIGVAVTTLISCAIQHRQVRSVYPPTGTVDVPPPARREARGYLVSLGSIAVLDAFVWNRSEVFFLGLHGTAVEIGFYSLGYGLATRMMVLPEVMVGALLPAFSALDGRNDRDRFRDVYRSALRYVALIGVPMTAVGTALAPAVFRLLYGEAFAAAAPLFQWFAIVGVIGAMRKVAWTALFAVGDCRYTFAATAVAAVANVGLAVALVPGFTTTGALVANGVAQAIAAACGFAAIARIQRCGFPVVDLVKVTAAGVLTLAVTRVLAGTTHDPVHLAGAAAAGLTVFVGASVLLGAVGLREWELFLTSTRRIAAFRLRRA
jgi:O-antigen/teichoic acid export membrane protein